MVQLWANIFCVIFLLPCSLVIGSENEYIECRQGNTNIILTSPHGGKLDISSIPDRSQGCRISGKCVYNHNCGTTHSKCKVTTSNDGYTKELTNLLDKEIQEQGSRTPYVIINHLPRIKLDMNRDKAQAAFGVEEAEVAYDEYTTCINNAKAEIEATGKRGALFDIHGVRTHPEQWVEIGYRISKSQLNSGEYTSYDKSIKGLADTHCGSDNECFKDLVTGDESFGGMLQNAVSGYKVIPSPRHVKPNTGGYYRGGYTTDTHGSKNGGAIDAIQIETPAKYRSSATSPNYAKDLAGCIIEFMDKYY